MVRGKEVVSADGERWRVRRRWMDREPPRLRKRFGEWREVGPGLNPLDALNALDLADSLPAAIGIAIATLVIVLVLLPLLGVALELVLLLALVGWGLAGKLALGRPWIVEAINLDRPERSAAYAVPGWGSAGRAVEELAASIAAGGPPEALTRGPRIERAP